MWAKRANQNRDIQGVRPEADPAPGIQMLHLPDYLGLCPALLQSSCTGPGRDTESHCFAPENLPGYPGWIQQGARFSNIGANSASFTNSRAKVVFIFFFYFLSYLLFSLSFYYFIFLFLFSLFFIFFFYLFLFYILFTIITF